MSVATKGARCLIVGKKEDDVGTLGVELGKDEEEGEDESRCFIYGNLERTKFGMSGKEDPYDTKNRKDGLFGLLLQAGLIFLGQFLKALELGRVTFRPVALLAWVLGQIDEKVFLVGIVHFGNAGRAGVLAGFGVELPIPFPYDPLAVPVAQLPIVAFMWRRSVGIPDHSSDRFAVEAMPFGNLRSRPLGQGREPVGTGHELFAHFPRGCPWARKLRSAP